MDEEELARIKTAWSRNPGGTHYDGCRKIHPECAVVALTEEVERMRDQRDAMTREAVSLRGEVERLRGGLERLANPRCDCGMSHLGGHDYACVTRDPFVHRDELWWLLHDQEDGRG